LVATRNNIIAALHAVERIKKDRVEVWRVILAPDGTVVARIYRGSFNAPPGSHIGEPQHQEVRP
jgi:hypothetical protein